MINLKKGVVYLIILFIILISLSVANAGNTSQSETATIVKETTLKTSSFDKLRYIESYNNFSNVPLFNLSEKRVGARRLKNVKIRTHHSEKDKYGFVIDNSHFVLHVIACNKHHKTCNFRLNGDSLTDLSATAKNEIPLIQNFTIKINSIDFDYCDGRRFCDYYYESYDRINLTVDLRPNEILS